MYGRVAAGIPLKAVEDVIDFEEIPQHWDNSYEYFALKIAGDSMQPRMYSGDVVIVRKQDDCDSGDIAIVLAIFNGNRTIGNPCDAAWNTNSHNAAGIGIVIADGG